MVLINSTATWQKKRVLIALNDIIQEPNNNVNTIFENKTPTKTVGLSQDMITDKDTKKLIPKEIDEQRKIMFENIKQKIDKLPKGFLWLVNDIKKGGLKVLDEPEFQDNIDEIFKTARKQQGNEEKNVIDLLKSDTVFNEIYDCMKSNTDTKNYKFVNDILKNNFIKIVVKNSINKGELDFLLYGEKENKK